MAVCDLHNEIREVIKDHEKRIVSLEKSDAESAVRVDMLCQKLDSLTNWVKALVISLITALSAFFFWYVQSLPR